MFGKLLDFFKRAPGAGKLLDFFRRAQVPEKAVPRERRKRRRLFLPYSARVGPIDSLNPPENKSYIRHFSDEGIEIESTMLFKEGSKIYLVLEIDDKNYEAEGEVVWGKKAGPGLMKIFENIMGIRFTNTGEGFKEFYEEQFKEELAQNRSIEFH